MRIRTPIASAVLVLLAASGTGQDAPDPGWRFVPGARLEILREVRSRTVTTTSLDGAEPIAKEVAEEATTTFDASVRSVTDAGDRRIECALREFSFRRGTGAEVLSVAAFLDPRGEPRVNIRTGADAPLTEEAGILLRKVAARLFRCRFELSLSPRGEVLSATFTGRLFDDLGVGGSHSRIVQEMLRSLYSDADLAGLFGDSLFTRLPGGEPDAGASWPAERRLRLAGMELSGRGTARILAGEDGAELRVEENLEFTVNAKALQKRTKALIETMFAGMKQPATAEVEIAEVPGIPARIVTTFGRNGETTTVWDELTIPVTGRVRLDLDVEQGAAEVVSETKATLRTVIRRL